MFKIIYMKHVVKIKKNVCYIKSKAVVFPILMTSLNLKIFEHLLLFTYLISLKLELDTMIFWYALYFNKLHINYHQAPINFLSSPTLVLLFWPSLSPASFFSSKFQFIHEFLSIIITTETIGCFKQSSETTLRALSLEAPLQNF